MRDAAGTLSVGGTVGLTLTTRVRAGITAPVTLSNEACTGATALTRLGLTAADGPQPPDTNGLGGADCRTANVIGTPVVSGQAQASIVKESSADGTTWVDPVGSAPTIVAANNTMRWRFRITTPNVAQNANQQTIPTLVVSDSIPAILNVASPGAGVPGYVTPAVSITTTASGASGACPASLAAGSGNLSCTFTNVAPGADILVEFAVNRPFEAGSFTNTASLSSPNAILTAFTGGQLSDAAALVTEGRVDPVATAKSINPPNSANEPRIGQIVTFTVTARNYGPNAVNGPMTIVDNLDPSKYALLGVTGSGVDCSATNLAAGTVSCATTGTINRYDFRTIQISARILKPASLPPSGTVFPNETNTATVSVNAATNCEFKTETTSNASVSTACNDAASTSNNSRTATFDIKVPQIDLQQRKARVLPAGQSSFGFGDQIRYRLRAQNLGPSRTENVVVSDCLNLPSSHSATLNSVQNVNAAAAEGTFTLDTGKTGTLACAAAAASICEPPAPNAGTANFALQCTLATPAANNFLDPGREVNFEVVLDVAGPTTTAITISNSARVCADETAGYESSGACSFVPATAGNNFARVNDVILPKADLALAKTTVTALPVDVNQPVRYDLVVRNLGPAATTQVRVSDVLPPNFEFFASGANAPAVVLGSFVTAAPSTVTGANVACTPTPAAITSAGQSQTVACVIDAVGGAFPGSSDPNNTITLRIHARAKDGFFSGPYLTNRDNTATVSPGLDGSGNPLSLDTNASNNSATSSTQVRNASIGGRVFLDRNGNNVQDGTAPAQDEGIGNVTLTLTGTDAYGNPVSRTVTTVNTVGATRGDYLFDNLPPSNAAGYTITETQPTGYINGPPQPGTGTTAAGTGSNTPTTSVIAGVVLSGGQNGVNFNFPEPQGLEISGFVYLDANNDGNRSGDAPIPGVNLTISGYGFGPNGVDDGGVGDDLPITAVTSTQTATTDANGRYEFRVSQSGRYTVTEQTAQPVVSGTTTLRGLTTAGTINGSGTPGTARTLAAEIAGPLPSQIANIVLQTGASSVENNFGEILPGGIAGFVYSERGGGVGRQPSDDPFPGVTLTLTGTDDLGNPVTRTTTTNGAGAYRFDNLRPGTYTVTETNPPGINDATPGSFAGTSGGSTFGTASGPNVVSGIAIVPGRNVVETNFAELNGPGRATSLSGYVYADNNDNGRREPGANETGFAGVTIRLTGRDSSGNAVDRTTTTDANGFYEFGNLQPGTYTVTEVTEPPNTTNGLATPGSTGGVGTDRATQPSTIRSIVLSSGDLSVNNNFGEIPRASISGNVYNDVNNNGVRDPGEQGYGGQTIVLTGTDSRGQPVNRTTTTNPDGSYAFNDLPPGSYTVTQPAQPPGSSNGITTPGTINGAPTGTATGVNTTPSAISTITLAGGQSSINNNFGEISASPNVVVTKAAIGAFATGNAASYRITVANIGGQPTNGAYTVRDRLPNGMTLAGTPSGSGFTCDGAAGGTSFTCTSSSVINANASNPNQITVPVNIAANATGGAPQITLNNAVLVEGGGEDPSFGPSPAERNAFNGDVSALPVCTTPTQNACRVPTTVLLSASVSGTVWFDTGSDRRQLDGGDRRLPGWIVEVIDASTGEVVRRVTTNPDGTWRADNLIPGREYLIRFRDPQTGTAFGPPVSGERGTPPAPCLTNNPGNSNLSSCVDGGQLRIVLTPGVHLPQQSLPLVPGGVVYDAVSRQPVPGSVVTLEPNGPCPGFDPATQIINAGIGGYTISGQSISMTVGQTGAYLFLFAPNAPLTCQFRITVTPPPSNTFISQLLPPQGNPLAPPPGTGSVNVQPQATPPAGNQATDYYLLINAGSNVSAIINNHIPLDPADITGIVLTKSAAVREVELGDSLQYVIRVRNTTALNRPAVFIDDQLPAGFRFIPGTAQVERGATVARIADPLGAPGARLTFAVGAVAPNAEVVLTYRVRVGVGSGQGNGINRAIAKPRPDTDCRAQPAQCSNEARWQVRITGGVFTTEACVAGKIFVDCNRNSIQDREELGIPGVRLYFEDGTSLISDSEGKYSYCGLPPKLHVLKVDPATLPRGSRLTTSSNRNAGDANSLFIDLKKGELHRADFIEGSCSNTVLEQVKARRTQGEVSAPQTEKKDGQPLRFRGKAPGYPQQGTDSADQQPAVRPRPEDKSPPRETKHENDVPTWQLPLNQPQGGAGAAR